MMLVAGSADFKLELEAEAAGGSATWASSTRRDETRQEETRQATLGQANGELMEPARLANRTNADVNTNCARRKSVIQFGWVADSGPKA